MRSRGSREAIQVDLFRRSRSLRKPCFGQISPVSGHPCNYNTQTVHAIQLCCVDLGSVNGFGTPKGHNYLRQAGPVISLATVDTTMVRSPDHMGIYLVEMETTRLYKQPRQRQKSPIIRLLAVHFKLIIGFRPVSGFSFVYTTHSFHRYIANHFF